MAFRVLVCHKFLDEVEHGPQYPIRELGDSSVAGSIDAAGGGARGRA